MEIDPKRLAFLLAVARNGSILAAADALHLTPSAVSQQVSALEREQGVLLLDRGPRGVTLTPGGRILVETAESIERELIEARSRLVETQEDVTGTVAIGAFQTVISGLLAPRLAELHAELPGISITLRDGTTARLPRMLRTAEVDLIILDRELDDSTPPHTADVPFLDEPWRLVAPQGTTAELGPAEIAKLPWLGVASVGASVRAVERARASLGVSTPPVHGYDDFQTALALVAAGQGITLLPDLVLQQGLPEGVVVIDRPGLGSRHLTIRHRATRREPSGATEAVIGALGRLVREAEPGEYL
ncbi:LysR family transcriptional regulator [Mycetocola spongiae]|nr:LysR family transcriptional regulator [Mycetocola spongiae]